MAVATSVVRWSLASPRLDGWRMRISARGAENCPRWPARTHLRPHVDPCRDRDSLLAHRGAVDVLHYVRNARSCCEMLRRQSSRSSDLLSRWCSTAVAISGSADARPCRKGMKFLRWLGLHGSPACRRSVALGQGLASRTPTLPETGVDDVRFSSSRFAANALPSNASDGNHQWHPW